MPILMGSAAHAPAPLKTMLATAAIPTKPPKLRPCKQPRLAIFCSTSGLRPCVPLRPRAYDSHRSARYTVSRGAGSQPRNKPADLRRRDKRTRRGATMNMSAQNMSAHNCLAILRRGALRTRSLGPCSLLMSMPPLRFSVSSPADGRAAETDQPTNLRWWGVVTQPLTLPECTKAGPVSSRQRWIKRARLGNVDQPGAPRLSVTHTTLTSARGDADLSTQWDTPR
jgi:hypothetical protein